jgi:hypothetical protein
MKHEARSEKIGFILASGFSLSGFVLLQLHHRRIHLVRQVAAFARDIGAMMLSMHFGLARRLCLSIMFVMRCMNMSTISVMRMVCRVTMHLAPVMRVQ